MMMKHLYISVFALTLSADSLFADPEKPGEEKKLIVKPPLPDLESDLPLLPPPVKRISGVESVPAPRVNDTNKPFDVIMVAAAEDAKPAEGRIAVGFFNHGERDLTLEIDKRSVTLSSRHYVQLKLPREFTWREKDGAMQTTKVADDAEGVEIVFRR